MTPGRSLAHVPSPGNTFSPSGVSVPPMRMPHLDFIYRIVCDMDPDVTEIRNADKTGVTRLVLPILSGSVRGPRIEGKIVERSGADWAEQVCPVNAHGIYRTRPGKPERFTPTVSQDDVEYFTHITFEAPGGSFYGWMNEVFAIGVMTMFEGRPVIDCYRLTNFPGKPAERL